VLDGRLAPGMRLPASRELADMLAISRNTVVLVYEKLAEDGYLENRPRNGYYVSERYRHHPHALQATPEPASGTTSHAVDWQTRMLPEPPGIKWLDKPGDWQRHRYPFLYGQFDPSLFPIADWRECSRQALDVTSIRGWAPDAIDHDNASLVEQLIKRVLPRRGIAARRDEVLLTVGAQQALYLVSELLVPPGSTVRWKTRAIWMLAISSCAGGRSWWDWRWTATACCPMRPYWPRHRHSIALPATSARPVSRSRPSVAWHCWTGRVATME